MSAQAGSRRVLQVVIDDTARSASGALGAARQSTDSAQFISCYNEAGPLAVCVARNSAGLQRACTTTDPRHVATIRALRSDSHIFFAWRENGQCRSVVMTISSRDPPKL